MDADNNSIPLPPPGRLPRFSRVEKLEIALKVVEVWPAGAYTASVEPEPVRSSIVEMVDRLEGLELDVLLYVTSLLYLRQGEAAVGVEEVEEMVLAYEEE